MAEVIDLFKGQGTSRECEHGDEQQLEDGGQEGGREESAKVTFIGAARVKTAQEIANEIGRLIQADDVNGVHTLLDDLGVPTGSPAETLIVRCSWILEQTLGRYSPKKFASCVELYREYDFNDLVGMIMETLRSDILKSPAEYRAAAVVLVERLSCGE